MIKWKTEIETIKKTQKETTLEIENLKEKAGVADACFNSRL